MLHSGRGLIGLAWNILAYCVSLARSCTVLGGYGYS